MRDRRHVRSLTYTSAASQPPPEQVHPARSASRRGRAGAASVMAALLLILLWAAAASAHVDVLPTRVGAGEAQKFTIRVPSERAVDTTAVEVLFPTQIAVYAIRPLASWRAQVLLRPDKRMRGVVFSGGRIANGEFQEFEVLGTPQEAGTALWRARQTYADGVVKPWTGPPERPGEVSTESGPGQPGPAAATTIAVAGQAIDAAASAGSADSSTGTWLGVIAIAISALAALGVGFLWSTRPARLPGDEP